MKRRSLLIGSAGIALAAGTAAIMWRPDEAGKPHNPYFSALNQMLKQNGPGRPVMLLDLDRVDGNIDKLAGSVGAEKTFRVVVKSLPSVELLEYVMRRAKTNALMVFHQPFLNAIAEAFPDADCLLGKPLPVSAARTFYQKLQRTQFDPRQQVQWLIDSQQRLQQYQAMAQALGIKIRVNFEIDVGLHRGGLVEPAAITPLLEMVRRDPEHLELAGLMGYEPQLTGLQATLRHPDVAEVLSIYQGFIDQLRFKGFDLKGLTFNGAGSHTLAIYPGDRVMNDLSAGSGVVKPTDFDTYHLDSNWPAIFIGTPVLKRYDELKIPGDPWFTKPLQAWDPNRRRLYYIYGGYWKAQMVSPEGTAAPMYQSTNQSPVTTSLNVDLQVDDYMFLRPTQSEQVMLQFGDLLPFRGSELVAPWPVFHETG